MCDSFCHLQGNVRTCSAVIARNTCGKFYINQASKCCDHSCACYMHPRKSATPHIHSQLVLLCDFIDSTRNTGQGSQRESKSCCKVLFTLHAITSVGCESVYISDSSQLGTCFLEPIRKPENIQQLCVCFLSKSAPLRVYVRTNLPTPSGSHLQNNHCCF